MDKYGLVKGLSHLSQEDIYYVLNKAKMFAKVREAESLTKELDTLINIVKNTKEYRQLRNYVELINSNDVCKAKADFVKIGKKVKLRVKVTEEIGSSVYTYCDEEVFFPMFGEEYFDFNFGKAISRVQRIAHVLSYF